MRITVTMSTRCRICHVGDWDKSDVDAFVLELKGVKVQLF